MTHRYRRNLRDHLIGSIAAVTATAVAAAVGIVILTGASAATTSSTQSGVVGKGGQSQVAAFAKWRGSPVTVVTDYLGGNTWSDIANTSWAGARWSGTSYHVVWSMFMLPLNGSGNLATGATGAYNSYFKSAAQELVAGGQGSSTIRLGWELTGNWYPWAEANNPSAFAAYWRQIVTTMRSVSGAHFTFDFDISDQQVDPTPAYPGDAYVDYFGGDFYDQSWGNFSPQDHVAAWNYVTTRPYGLNWVASFAAAHGKKISFPEWGLDQRCDGHGGGDDTYYIQHMYDWIASHNVGYETYFDFNDDSCHEFSVSGGLFPNAASLYRNLWKNGFSNTTSSSAAATSASATKTSASPSATKTSSSTPSSTAPSSSAPPTSTATALRVAWQPDRSISRPLSGQTLSGNDYVYVTAPTGTRQVLFKIDGTTARTETTVPYDLAGGSTAAATPYNFGGLSQGTHTVTATITSSTGATSTLSASFTVAGSLSVSKSASRSSASALEGATESGSIYVFDAAPSGTQKVLFYLDGSLYRTETSTPFDLAGTGASGANAFSVSSLGSGLHTIIAKVTLSNGSVATTAGTFRV